MIKTFKQFLTEGGNAIAGVSRLNQENSIATVDKVYSTICPLLKIKKEDLALLGSATKKKAGETSGDIDMAVSVHALMLANGLSDADTVLEFIAKRVKTLGHEAKILKGFNIVTVAFPISNTDKKQFDQTVQLDLMLSDDLQASIFGFYSPLADESAYKGIYRNLFFAAILYNFDAKVIKKHGTEPIEYEKYIWTATLGLQKTVRKRGVDKKGKLLKKEEVVKRETIAKNPDAVVKHLFGSKFNADDVSTIEKISVVINSRDFKFYSKRKKIVTDFLELLSHQNLSVPKEFK